MLVEAALHKSGRRSGSCGLFQTLTSPPPSLPLPTGTPPPPTPSTNRHSPAFTPPPHPAPPRPQAALQHFGMFKSCTLDVYLLHRCWQFEPNLPLDFLDSSRSCIRTAFSAARKYLMAMSEPEKHQQLKTFYDTFAEITLMNDVLRLSGLPPPLVGVAVRDLRDALTAFEHLRCFSDYRTPSGIRAFMTLCQYLIPLLLTPYFAHMGTLGSTTGARVRTAGGGGGGAVKRPRQQPAHPQYANYWAPLTGKRHIPPHPAQPQHTNYWERGNDTSRSTGRSGRQKAATRRNMRREERVTVQGPVKEQQPDGMSHRGGGAGLLFTTRHHRGGAGVPHHPRTPRDPSRQQ